MATKQEKMRPAKAWAVVMNNGKMPTPMYDYMPTFSCEGRARDFLLTTHLECIGGRLVRVEIREVPRKRARRKL